VLQKSEAQKVVIDTLVLQHKTDPNSITKTELASLNEMITDELRAVHQVYLHTLNKLDLLRGELDGLSGEELLNK